LFVGDVNGHRDVSLEKSTTLLKQRAVINFCVNLGMTPKQTKENMEIVSGTKNVLFVSLKVTHTLPCG
jgi:hypothetical protein